MLGVRVVNVRVKVGVCGRLGLDKGLEKGLELS